MEQPMGFFFAQKYKKNPFFILMSCLLSLRARDVVTLPISEKLFSAFIHTRGFYSPLILPILFIPTPSKDLGAHQ